MTAAIRLLRLRKFDFNTLRNTCKLPVKHRKKQQRSTRHRKRLRKPETTEADRLRGMEIGKITAKTRTPRRQKYPEMNKMKTSNSTQRPNQRKCENKRTSKRKTRRNKQLTTQYKTNLQHRPNPALRTDLQSKQGKANEERHQRSIFSTTTNTPAHQEKGNKQADAIRRPKRK